MKTTLADVRIAHARLIVAVVALIVSAAILWLARGFTFYFDEWTFVLTAPDWTAVTFLQPHNEHPSMLLRAVYAILLNTVGLRSYVPYLAVLLLLHATDVVLLFELVRRRSGDLLALAAAALLLVLGAGWENLLWAFQLAWLASVALGLGMLLCLQGASTKRRMALATALLLGSLMFSGLGLVFAVAATVMLVATPGRRRDLAWLVPVGLALMVWYIAFGRGGVEPTPPPSAANITLMPTYLVWGMGSGAAALIGEGGWIGPVLLLASAAAVAWTWRRRGADPLALSIAAALVAFYIVTGATRAQLGYQQSASGRYVYEGALFWLVLLTDAARALPWRGTWRPALVACLFLACFNSGVLLVSYAAAKTAQMEREAADLQALADERTDPCLNPNGAVDLLVMPQVTRPADFYRAADLYGFPAPSVPIDQAALAAAKVNLRKLGC